MQSDSRWEKGIPVVILGTSWRDEPMAAHTHGCNITKKAASTFAVILLSAMGSRLSRDGPAFYNAAPPADLGTVKLFWLQWTGESIP